MPAGSILVADDDAAIRTVLNQALSRAGYEVRSTGNAATLWRWISQGDGDLIITDVLLPDESAFDLLPRIKKAQRKPPPDSLQTSPAGCCIEATVRRRELLLDEQHLAIGRQRPQVVGDQHFQLVRHVADRLHGRQHLRQT